MNLGRRNHYKTSIIDPMIDMDNTYYPGQESKTRKYRFSDPGKSSDKHREGAYTHFSEYEQLRGKPLKHNLDFYYQIKWHIDEIYLIPEHNIRKRYKNIRQNRIFCLALTIEQDASISKNLKAQIVPLCFNIIYYLESNPDSTYSIEYIEDTLQYGPSFSKHLKDLRYYSFNYSVSEYIPEEVMNKIIELDEQVYRVKMSQNRGYPDYLQEIFLPLWEEDCDDFEWSFKPLKEITSENVLRFQNSLREVLNKYKTTILRPSKSEKNSWVNDNSCYYEHKKSNLRDIQRNLKKQNNLEVKYTNNFIFRRTVVPVGPANSRDTWIREFKSSYYQLQIINHKCRQILEKIPNYFGGHPVRLRKKVKTFLSDIDNSLFLEWDIKKWGLTFDRKLIILSIPILQEIYPDEEWEYLRGFENVTVYDQGGMPRHPLRGFGLGNINELSSIIHCAILNMTKNDFLVTSDDAVIRINSSNFNSYDHLGESEMKRIGRIYDTYNFISSPSKIIISKCFRICELYYNTKFYKLDYTKNTLAYMPMSNALFKRSISDSKNFIYQYLTMYSSLGIDDFIRMTVIPDMIYFRGYEHNRYIENKLPLNYGGYRPNTRSSLDEVLRDCEEDEELMRIFYLLDKIDLATLQGSPRQLHKKGKQLPSLWGRDWKITKSSDDLNKIQEFLLGSTIEDISSAQEDILNIFSLSCAKTKLYNSVKNRQDFDRIKVFKKIEQILESKSAYSIDFMMYGIITKVRSISSSPMAIPLSLVKTERIYKNKSIKGPYLWDKSTDIDFGNPIESLTRFLSESFEEFSYEGDLPESSNANIINCIFARMGYARIVHIPKKNILIPENIRKLVSIEDFQVFSITPLMPIIEFYNKYGLLPIGLKQPIWEEETITLLNEVITKLIPEFIFTEGSKAVSSGSLLIHGKYKSFRVNEPFFTTLKTYDIMFSKKGLSLKGELIDYVYFMGKTGITNFSLIRSHLDRIYALEVEKKKVFEEEELQEKEEEVEETDSSNNKGSLTFDEIMNIILSKDKGPVEEKASEEISVNTSEGNYLEFRKELENLSSLGGISRRRENESDSEYEYEINRSESSCEGSDSEDDLAWLAEQAIEINHERNPYDLEESTSVLAALVNADSRLRKNI